MAKEQLALIKNIWPDINDGVLEPEHYSRFLEYLDGSSSTLKVPLTPSGTPKLNNALHLIGQMHRLAAEKKPNSAKPAGRLDTRRD